MARRVREAGVYSEIVPFNSADDALERLRPQAVILSGGPASVTEGDTTTPGRLAQVAAEACILSKWYPGTS